MVRYFDNGSVVKETDTSMSASCQKQITLIADAILESRIKYVALW